LVFSRVFLLGKRKIQSFFRFSYQNQSFLINRLFSHQNRPFSHQIQSFPIKIDHFPIKIGRFPIKIGRFPIKIGRFPMKNAPFSRRKRRQQGNIGRKLTRAKRRNLTEKKRKGGIFS
jgi:hypothetical protein